MLSNIMKSGINYTHGKTGENGDTSKTPYYKGMIFQYFLDEKQQYKRKIHSEKAAIKKSVLNEGTEVEDEFVSKNFHESFEDEIDCRFVRAIIGLPQQYEYRIDKKNDHSSRQGIIAVENKVYRKKDNDNEPIVTRYENPIHFKPYGSFLLIIPQVIPNKMKKQSFYLIKTKKNAKRIENKIVIHQDTKYKIIKTPEDFDLITFLNYCRETYNKDKQVLLSKFSDSSRPSTTIRNAVNRITSIEKA